MATKSGAGAAVSSGASYQARIAAYLFVTNLCGAESLIARDRKIASIAFETAEEIDDLNVNFDNGSVAYIQAKSSIDFSPSPASVLFSVVSQFIRQHQKNPNSNDEFLLITQSGSSKKITNDMRATLDIYRTTSPQTFERDQPQAFTRLISDLRSLVSAAHKASGGIESTDFDSEQLLRKIHVLPIDLDDGDPLQEALLILLHANRFASPPAVWGKIVADCISHSKNRTSLTPSHIHEYYGRFQIGPDQETPSSSSVNELLSFEIQNSNFPVGREVVLCEPPSKLGADADLAILEMYRFDEDCNERVKFGRGTCTLLSGEKLKLVRRAATFQGLQRLTEAEPNLLRGKKIVMVGINSDENFEQGLCAETHKERLRQAWTSNSRPMDCVHCDLPLKFPPLGIRVAA